MRLGIGVAILLYGLVLSLNTTAPMVAELAGHKVTITLRGDLSECSRMMGVPPYRGVYGSCPAEWAGSSHGKIFGRDVAKEIELHHGGPMEAYRYPFFSDLANLAPRAEDKAAAIVAILLVMLGILISVTERRRRRADGAERSEETEEETARLAHGG